MIFFRSTITNNFASLWVPPMVLKLSIYLLSIFSLVQLRSHEPCKRSWNNMCLKIELILGWQQFVDSFYGIAERI